MTDEWEIYDGARAWPEAQRLFTGAVDPGRAPWVTRATWYGTSVDPREGAFCLVQIGGPGDEAGLVGELLKISYRDRAAYLYCLGGAELPADIGLSRRAWLALEMLWLDDVTMTIEVVSS